MSNFTNVSNLNVAYGNQKGDPHNPDWVKLEAQAKNILDEYNELMKDGIGQKSIKDVRDAICDILVFTYGLGHIAGIDVDMDMDAVDVSNRSKFCATEAELKATLAKYQDLGVSVYAEGEFPFARVKSAKDQLDVNGKEYRLGKMLKGMNFKEPVFSEL